MRNVYSGRHTAQHSAHGGGHGLCGRVVMSASSNDRFAPILRDLKGLARSARWSCWRWGDAELASELDVQCLFDDPATAAEGLARRFVLG